MVLREQVRPLRRAVLTWRVGGQEREKEVAMPALEEEEGRGVKVRDMVVDLCSTGMVCAV